MKRLLAGSLVFLILACGNKTEKKNLISLLPQEAAVVVQSPNLKHFADKIKEITFLTTNNLRVLENSRQQLNFLQRLESLPNSLLAFSGLEEENFTLTLLSETTPEISLDSVQNKSVEILKFEGLEILKYEIEEDIFYSTHTKNGIFLASNSLKNLKNLLEREFPFEDAEFERTYKTIDLKKNSVLIHQVRAGKIVETWFPNLLDKVTGFGSWSSLDLGIANGTLTANGLSLWSKKPGLQEIFAETGAGINQISQIVPGTASAYLSFSFKDFEKFEANLKKQNPNGLKEEPAKELIRNSTEAGIVNMDQGNIFAINSLDASISEEILAPFSSTAGEFRGVEIFTFEEENIFETSLQPIISVEALRFYTFLENFVVFAETRELVEKTIAAFQNNKTLNDQSYFKEALDHLSGASNLLMVANTGNFNNLLEENIAEKHLKEIADLDFGNYKMAALQVIAESGYSHLHGVFINSNVTETPKKSEQLLSVKLETDILNQPQLVKNHLNNEMDIVVQDIDNVLYLISNKGKIFWKKQLNGPIQGEIKQVDLLKNGRLQLAFATPNRLEIIDRNGNEVKPFPLKFRDEITQPLSVFDYDNNRNYRLLITQGRELYIYDSKGKRVRGFGFSKAGSEVKFPPKHIRMGNKDYILVAENSGKLNILSRQGKERVKLSETFELSENEWFQHEGNFISGGASGALITIDEKGNIKRENLILAENYRINATPNMLVSLSENVLKIRQKEINLDFGLYTPPQIFLVNNIYYITTTDLQARKVYVFNSRGELLPRFPVYGTSEIDINNADNESNPEFTVKGEDEEILLYRF